MRGQDEVGQRLRAVGGEQHQQAAPIERPAVVELQEQPVRLLRANVIVMDPDRLPGGEAVGGHAPEFESGGGGQQARERLPDRGDERGRDERRDARLRRAGEVHLVLLVEVFHPQDPRRLLGQPAQRLRRDLRRHGGGGPEVVERYRGHLNPGEVRQRHAAAAVPTRSRMAATSRSWSEQKPLGLASPFAALQRCVGMPPPQIASSGQERHLVALGRCEAW